MFIHMNTLSSTIFHMCALVQYMKNKIIFQDVVKYQNVLSIIF